MKQSNFMAKDFFFFHNGHKAQNLLELLEIVKTLDEANFNIHVNNEKNDFSAWIRYSLGNSPLANKISKITNKEELTNCINDELGIKIIKSVQINLLKKRL